MRQSGAERFEFSSDSIKRAAGKSALLRRRSQDGLLQLHVQSSQLFQEAPVWEDPAVLFDLEDGLLQAEVLVDHQVGQDDGGRPAHPDSTVDKDPSCSGQKSDRKEHK